MSLTQALFLPSRSRLDQPPLVSLTSIFTEKPDACFAALTAAVIPPALAIWLSFNMTIWLRSYRCVAPPPTMSAYFSTKRNPVRSKMERVIRYDASLLSGLESAMPYHVQVGLRPVGTTKLPGDRSVRTSAPPSLGWQIFRVSTPASLSFPRRRSPVIRKPFRSIQRFRVWAGNSRQVILEVSLADERRKISSDAALEAEGSIRTTGRLSLTKLVMK